MALAGACSHKQRQQPPLDELYGSNANIDQPPLIVIPGAFGSRLLDTHSGKEIWPRSSTKLLLSSFKGLEVEFDEDTHDPTVIGIRPHRIFRQGLGRDFYGQILETLQGAGGYTRRRPGEPVAPGQKNFYVFMYDWRLDNISALQGLHRLIQQIRSDYGIPDLRIDILAHSNGGLMARYHARYGPVDHLNMTARRQATPGRRRSDYC